MDPLVLIGFGVVGVVLLLVILFFSGIIFSTGRGGRDAAPPGSDPTCRRLLVLLTTDCVDEDVCRRLASGPIPVEVRVAVPLLSGHLDYYVAGDDREALPAAELRLERALGALHAHGIAASGVVGDMSASATQLAADEVAGFGPDEIVLVVHPEAEEQWAEHHLVRDAAERFTVPITLVRAFEPEASLAVD